MKNKLYIIGLLTIVSLSSQAQDEHDALRYGISNYYGTARSTGVGNAVGSMGGDFSTLSINPAGIGIYRKSEFTISPTFQNSKNEGTYNNESISFQKSRLNLGQVGVVLTNAKKGNNYKRSKWKTGAFGFGLNRVANFHNNYGYTGKNYNNSITNRWVEDFNSLGGINNYSLSNVNFSAFGAYQTYLIDKGFGADSNLAVSYVPAKDGIQQTKRVTETGGINEIVISGGGNYMEKLMIGATLGITTYNYNRTFRFDETDLSGNLSNDFKYLKYSESLSTDGTGINLKLGAILQATNSLRLGLAFHTPTTIQFNDVSYISMESHTDSLLTRNNPSASSITSYMNTDTSQAFNYTLNTPYKAIASGTLIINKSGFISADIEYIDYASMKYNFGNDFVAESESINQTIQNTYKSAVNIRIGAEAKIKDVSLRAGFAMYGSPYQNSSVNADRMQLSLGTGYRTNTWFIDAALQYSNHKYNEKPYHLASNSVVNNATVNNNRTMFVLTTGWKF